MKISEVLEAAKKRIKAPQGPLAAEVMLAYILNKKKEDLFVNDREDVSVDDISAFDELLRRYEKGEPVAYLTNKKEFYGLDFYVDANVLIPRPETELLVEKVLQLVNADFDSEAATILDVGTGCGNIAVSLAKNIEDVLVTASDISDKAVEIAKKNALLNGVLHKMDFAVSDLLKNIQGEYDIIVANLPYIGEEKFGFVSKEAYDYEPHLALFGGFEGLTLYERLFKEISELKWRPRYLLGEFGFLQADLARTLMNKYFDRPDCATEKDLASIERIFVIRF